MVIEAEAGEEEILGEEAAAMRDTETLTVAVEEGSTDVGFRDTLGPRHRVDETPEIEVHTVALHPESLTHIFQAVEAE